MTHDELLERLDELKWEVGDSGINEESKAVYALRAVVELHKPIGTIDGDFCNICSREVAFIYPCPTVQAIEKELK